MNNLATAGELAAETADSTLGHVDTAWADGTPGDNINESLDTLQAQDDWVAIEANVPTVAEIADGVWDEDTSGHGTASSFSIMLKDTSAYQGDAGTWNSTRAAG